MHPELIKARIRMNGWTPARIADELGVSRAMVGHVINGRGRSHTIEERIAQITGESIEALWPSEGRTILRRQKRNVCAAA